MDIGIVQGIYNKPILKHTVLIKSDMVDIAIGKVKGKASISDYLIKRHNAAVVRRTKIMSLIKKVGKIKVTDVSLKLNINMITTGSDITALAAKGFIKTYVVGRARFMECTA